MNELEIVQCARCGKIREKFLVGCPACGVIETVDPNQPPSAKDIDLNVIKAGAEFHKTNLEDEQIAQLREWIPKGQNWQFYAGMILAARLIIYWIKYLVPVDQLSLPMSIQNSRVYYLMSFMTKEKQQNFCDLLNTFNPNKEKKKDEENRQGMQS